MDAVYEQIMCSNVLDDDDRFRKIIDDAIKAGDVESYSKYTKETKARRNKRKQRAKAEEVEAMELAEELGVKDKLFGGGTKGAKKSKKDNGEDALRALIQQRQKGRAENFLGDLEAKYGGGKSSKRSADEPPEEMFQKNAKKSRSKAR
jgi:DnaJ family protein C protein 9